MESLGAELKALRQKQSVTLSEIAQDTRISLRHLQSLESGRYKDLPGGIYNRAFLRAYCEYLNLDPESYLRRYEDEANAGAEHPTRHQTAPFHPPVTRNTPVPLSWTVILLLSVTGLYFGKPWISSVFSPYFTPAREIPVTASGSSSVQTTESAELPGSAQSAARPEPMPEGTEFSDVDQSASSSGPPPETTASPGAAQTADGKAPPPPPLAAVDTPAEPDAHAPGTIRLEFKVVEQCWVSVSSDGNSVLVKLLEPGDDQSFSALERFYVILGNAGGVRARINGRPAKPFGKPGEVVRVLINEQNIEDLLEGNRSG